MLGEHLLDAGSDSLDLGVEALAGALGGNLGWLRSGRSVRCSVLVHAAMLGPKVAGIWEEAGLGFQSEEPEAADRQFVTVAEAAPFDDIAVEEDAVEAAVVEDA